MEKKIMDGLSVLGIIALIVYAIYTLAKINTKEKEVRADMELEAEAQRH